MLMLKYISLAVGIVIIFQINQIFCDEYKVVETSDGAVRGLKSTTWWNNVEYFSFKGIPYAEKPIGKLRFKPPQPKKSWAPKTIDAFEFGNRCLQADKLMPTTDPQDENCLFLNIFVPADLAQDEKLPVLFFIHGGGYQEGSANNYGPDFIVEKRVILVTINYRLGIFGFLSLNTTKYSGNMGLKDQQLALQWVHKNIEHFNGDNNQITVMGQSAGSSSTHLQILSPESRKYFKNAILMSGTALNYWAMSENNEHLNVAYRLSEKMGKPTNQLNELIENLKSASAEDLNKYMSEMFKLERTLIFPFAPVIERSDAEQPFITQSIEEIYENGGIHMNTIFTATSAEMLTFTAHDAPDILNINGLNSNFTLKLPFRSLNIESESKDFQDVMNEIRYFYFKNDAINNEKQVEYVDLLSDLNFVYSIDKIVKLHASKSTGQTFYGRFSVDSTLNVAKTFRSEIKIPGAAHGDDLIYLFRFSPATLIYSFVHYTSFRQQSKISVSTIQHMTNLMTDFAKINLTGCSTCRNVGFDPIQNGKINFLNVTNDGLIVGSNPNREAMELWANVDKKMEKYIGQN